MAGDVLGTTRYGCACADCAAYDGAPISAENGAAVAQKVQTLFIDDLDGSAAEGTVRFGLEARSMRST